MAKCVDPHQITHIERRSGSTIHPVMVDKVNVVTKPKLSINVAKAGIFSHRNMTV